MFCVTKPGDQDSNLSAKSKAPYANELHNAPTIYILNLFQQRIYNLMGKFYVWMQMIYDSSV